MFIDYVTLQLVNLSAGLVLLAWYVGRGLDGKGTDRWPAGFGIVGFVSLATGLHMSFTWPLPQMYNITHGELSVLFGVIFLATAGALARGWNLISIAVYAFFAGLASVVIGIRVIDLNLTLTPGLSGTGFILTGLAGMLSAPTLYLRANRLWRTGAVAVLLVAAGIWALIGYGAYWMHLESYGKYQPPTLRMPATQPATNHSRRHDCPGPAGRFRADGVG